MAGRRLPALPGLVDAARQVAHEGRPERRPGVVLARHSHRGADQLLNLKLTIFFFAFLPQFVPPGEAGGSWHMIGLSLVFMALTFVVFALYGLCAATMRDQVISRPRVMAWLRRTFAAT